MMAVSVDVKRAAEKRESTSTSNFWVPGNDAFVTLLLAGGLGRLRSQTRGQLRGIRLEVEGHAGDELSARNSNARHPRGSSIRRNSRTIGLAPPTTTSARSAFSTSDLTAWPRHVRDQFVRRVGCVKGRDRAHRARHHRHLVRRPDSVTPASRRFSCHSWSIRCVNRHLNRRRCTLCRVAVPTRIELRRAQRVFTRSSTARPDAAQAGSR